MKRFADLNEQEILALAISNEDEDNRIYRSFADRLRSAYPETAAMYDKMAHEEIGHRDMLLDLHRRKFGDFLPLIRRQDVKGFVARRPIWLNRTLSIEATRKFAEEMEYETARFYRRAAETAHDDSVRHLLRQLAAAEDKHESLAHELGEKITPKARAAEAIGAGISMAFAEALSDDGSLTGRGAPVVRGAVTGVMTAIGGVGHALPYLIPHFYVATSLACAVVVVELGVISWIRTRYMDTPFLQAAFQVLVGGALVFAAGILIGNS